MPPAREHIKKFGAEYHIRSVWDLARRRGFAHARPRPRGAGGASPSEAGKSKKKARRTAAVR